MMSWLAVGAGAAVGAWLRWWLGLWFNLLTPQIPLGTLFANLGGGYLVGLAVAFFSSHPGIPLFHRSEAELGQAQRAIWQSGRLSTKTSSRKSVRRGRSASAGVSLCVNSWAYAFFSRIGRRRFG